METVATAEVTSIRRRKDIEKSTWRTYQYFVDFESGIQVERSTSNWCHNFRMNSPFKIDEISRTFHGEIRRQVDGESTKMCPLGGLLNFSMSTLNE